MVRLVLVRHGQTVSNVDGLLDTREPGAELTELGRRQADALVDRLAGEPVEAVVASPLARTRATAAPLGAARGLPVRIGEGLREVSAGRYEGRGDREAHLAYLGVVASWGDGDPAPSTPGGETGRAFLDRFDAAVSAAVEGVDGTVVCVSHGAAIRSWAAARSVNLPAGWALDHGLPNTGMVVLEPAGGSRWRTLEWQGQPVADLDHDPTGSPVRS